MREMYMQQIDRELEELDNSGRWAEADALAVAQFLLQKVEGSSVD